MKQPQIVAHELDLDTPFNRISRFFVAFAICFVSTTAQADQTVCSELLITPNSRIVALFDLLAARGSTHLSQAAQTVNIIERKNWLSRRTAVKLIRPKLWENPSLMVFTPTQYKFNHYAIRMLHAQVIIRLAELAVHDVLFPKESRSYLPITPKQDIDTKIKRLAELESEVYSLFSELQLDSQLFVQADTGKSWTSRLLLFQRPQRSIKPNLTDYKLWLKNGDEGLLAELQARYKRMYQIQAPYDSLKRLTVAVMAIGIATGIPHVFESRDAILNTLQENLLQDEVPAESFQKKRAAMATEELSRITEKLKRATSEETKIQLEQERDNLLSAF